MKLSELLGQDRAVRRLQEFVSQQRVPPTLLFQGPNGVGKSLAAKAFYTALNCSKRKTDSCGTCPSCVAAANGADADLHYIDSAYQAGLRDEEIEKQRTIRIDTIRHAIETVSMRSFLGKWKAVIIEDAHMLEIKAENAMLKALEEPPAKTVWILTTHRPGDLLPTIRSRCQTVSFGPLSDEVLISILGDGAADTVSLAEGSLSRARTLMEDEIESPDSWISDPMGPFRLVDSLPGKLHLARPVVDKHLHRISWYIREKRGTEGYRSAAVRSVLRELDELRKSLKSTADPKLIVELAALRLQQLHSVGGIPA